MSDTTKLPPDLSVVIPVYKNASALDELQRRLILAMEKLNVAYEIIFVNDASPDDSLSILKQLSRNSPNVGILSLQSNVGQHMATLTGLRYARGNHALIMDADLQDPPEVIPDLWNAIHAPPDSAVVFAGKRGKYESQDRLIAALVFKRLLHWICGTPYDAGGFCLMNRKMVDRVISMPVRRPYLLSMIGSCRMPMKSIPVIRPLRPSGKSGYTTWKRFRLACSGIRIALQFKRHISRSAGSSMKGNLPLVTIIDPNLNHETCNKMETSG